MGDMRWIRFFLCIAAVQAQAVWLTSMESAVEQIHKTGKPLVILFLGEASSWSGSFEKEVLHNEEWEALLAEAVLLKVDGDKKWEELFHVTTFPQLVVTDWEGEEVMRFTSVPYSAPRWAASILEGVHALAEVKAFVTSALERASGEQLRSYYVKALTLHNPFYARAILDRGLAQEEDVFFLLRKYEQLLQKFSSEGKAARQLKERILGWKNSCQMHWELALIEFEGKKTQGALSSQEVVLPLLFYLKKFGAKDRRLQILTEKIVAEYFVLRARPQDAKEHAERAWACAEGKEREEIGSWIEVFCAGAMQP